MQQPDPQMPPNFTLTVQQTPAGLWRVTSSWHPGLEIIHPSLEAALTAVPTTMLRLIDQAFRIEEPPPEEERLGAGEPRTHGLMGRPGKL